MLCSCNPPEVSPAELSVLLEFSHQAGFDTIQPRSTKPENTPENTLAIGLLFVQTFLPWWSGLGNVESQGLYPGPWSVHLGRSMRQSSFLPLPQARTYSFNSPEPRAPQPHLTLRPVGEEKRENASKDGIRHHSTQWKQVGVGHNFN